MCPLPASSAGLAPSFTGPPKALKFKSSTTAAIISDEGPGTGKNVIATGKRLVTLIDSQVQGEIRTEDAKEVEVR